MRLVCLGETKAKELFPNLKRKLIVGSKYDTTIEKEFSIKMNQFLTQSETLYSKVNLIKVDLKTNENIQYKIFALNNEKLVEISMHKDIYIKQIEDLIKFTDLYLVKLIGKKWMLFKIVS